MKYSIVMHERILELSEFKSKHERLKRFVSNWKNVVFVALVAMTLKVVAEQLVLILVRRMS